MDLTKCIYENIKDTFYYGLFGDFRLVIDKATGYRALWARRQTAVGRLIL